jgi:hypothetical protein
MLEVIAYRRTAGKLAWRLCPLQGFLLNACILLFITSPALARRVDAN